MRLLAVFAILAVVLVSASASAQVVCSGDPTRLLVPFANDGSWTAVAREDDNSSDAITLPFTFTFFGSPKSQVFINNNGNVTFDAAYGDYNAAGFPAGPPVPPMIAPFWADVDTRPTASGQVWYKAIGGNLFVVTWANVGYFNQKTNRLNTFQVVLSDGTSALLGTGNTVAFSYDTMCWTTGDASQGSGGFGGTAATVGVNRGNGTDFFLIGRFNRNDSTYDGPGGNADGVTFLSGQTFRFDASAANTPPVVNGLPAGGTVVATAGQPLDLTVQFLSPESIQTTTVAVTDLNSAASRGLSITTTPGNIARARFQWTPGCCDQGVYEFDLTGTDNYSPPASTTVRLRIQVQCSNAIPVARAGGPYTAECAGAQTPVQLTGAASTDDSPSLTYAWTTTSPNATFQNPNVRDPILVVTRSGSCQQVIPVTLTVSDGTCSSPVSSTTVTVSDTQRPAVTAPTDVSVVGQVSGGIISASVSLGTASASDACAGSLPTNVSRSDGRSVGAAFSLGQTTVTYSATDGCNPTATATQRVTVTAPPLPDLTAQVLPLTFTQALTGQIVTVSWRITNSGAASASGWSDQLYLSTSSSGASPTSLGAPVVAPRALGPGESYDRTAQFTLPTSPGVYYVVVRTDVGGQVFEAPPSGETNNQAVSPASFELLLRPTPDLTVQSVSSPTTAVLSSSQVQVTFEVRNGGTGPTTVPNWNDAVFLVLPSQTLPLPPIDLNLATGLGSFQNQSFLPAGSSYIQTVTVQLPKNISGQYRFAVYTDGATSGGQNSQFAMAELDESNNVRYSNPFTIELEPQPDLRVLTVAPVGSSTVFSGQSVRFTRTLTNFNGPSPLGGRTPVGNWADQFYLSLDNQPQVSAGDIPLGGAVPAGPGIQLNPGQNWTGEASLTMPVAISGLYWVKVVTDSTNVIPEVGFEGNNVGVSAQQLDIRQSPPVDLVPTSLTVVPGGTIVPGQTLTFSWSVENEGAPPPNVDQSWQDVLVLSTDGVFDAADLVLSQQGASTSRQSASTVVLNAYTRTATFVVPASLTPGPYRAIVRVNRNDGLFEGTNSGNNTLVGTSVLTFSRDFADLQAQVTGTPPIGGVANGPGGALAYRVTNAGTVGTQVSNWTDRVVLSTAPNLGGTQYVLGSSQRSATLAANAAYDQQITFALPQVPAGSYYLNLVADADNAVLESQATRDNNRVSLPYIVSADLTGIPGGGGGTGGGGVGSTPAADLRITSASAPSGANAGSSITVGWSGSNAGTATTSTNTWIDRVYLSRSPSSIGGALQIGARTQTKAVGVNGAWSGVISADIPLDAEGVYFVLVIADSGAAVLDLNRGNNVGPSSPPSISIVGSPKANLVASGVSVTSTAVAGQPIPVTANIVNSGEGTTNVAEWRDAVYLSLDQFFDPGTDVYLGSITRSGALSLNASYVVLSNLSIPRGLAGSFYVLVRTNADGAVNEAGRSDDNVASSSNLVNVTLPPPVDLAVDSVLPPASVVLGQDATFRWRIGNSSSSTAEGLWTDALFLSPQPVWTPLAKPIRNFNPGPRTIAQGQSVESSGQAATPAVVPGQYYVVARTDVFNVVNETNDNNNSGASATPITVSAEPLSLNSIYTGSMPSGTDRYFEIDVPDGETLRFTLQHSDPAAWTELYVRFGDVPSPGSSDFAFASPGEAAQTVTVPRTVAGRYYVLARCTRGVGSAFTLRNQTIPFGIESVSPARAGTGRVTFAFTGSRWSAQTVFSLRPAGASRLVASTSITVGSASRAEAAFDLSGETPGVFDVVVTEGTTTAVLPNAVTLDPTTGPQLSVEVAPSPAYRIGVASRETIFIRNTGNVDVPLFEATIAAWNNPNATVRLLTDAGPVLLTPTNNTMSAAVRGRGLAPGESVSLSVDVLLSLGFPRGQEFGLSVAVRALEQQDFASQLRPVFDSYINGLRSPEVLGLIDPSQRQAYLAALDANAEALWVQSFASFWTTVETRAALRNAGGDFKQKCDDARFYTDLLCTSGGIFLCTGIGAFTGLVGGAVCGVVTYTACRVIDRDWGRCCDNQCICAPNSPGCLPPPPPPGQCKPPLNYCALALRTCAGGGSGGSCKPGTGSFDPNDKLAFDGFGAEKWVAKTVSLPYTVRFENLSTAAPAAEVRITDDLDPDLNPGSFRLGRIVVGDREILPPPDRINWSTTVDLTATRGLLLEITAGVDAGRTPAQAFWILRSIDPATGLPPVGADRGFLPPNDATRAGEGQVEFTIRPRSVTPDGTLVTNTASIIFDVNEPIITNTVSNTIDGGLPFSQLPALPAASPSAAIVLTPSGDDAPNGSGLAGYRFFVATDGGPFVPLGDSTPSASGVLLPEPGRRYQLRSQAVDNAGNVEPLATAPVVGTLVPNVAFAPGSDTGTPGDGLTRLRQPSFRLFSVPGTSVSVSIVGPTQLSSSAAIGSDATGVFTPGAPLADGEYTLVMTGSGQTSTLVFAVDGTASSVSQWASLPTSSGAAVPAITIASDGSTSEPRRPGVRRLRLQFTEPTVGFGPSAASVLGVSALTGLPVSLSGVTVSTVLANDGLSGEIVFSAALPDNARYCVQLQGVTDAAGNPINASRASFVALVGDASGDGRVNVTDLGGIRSMIGRPVTATDVNTVRSDIDADAVVSASDFDAARASVGRDARFAPPPCPAAPPLPLRMGTDVAAGSASLIPIVRGKYALQLTGIEPLDWQTYWSRTNSVRNSRGQRVANVPGADGRPSGVFIQPDGTSVDIGSLGGGWTIPTAINERGEVTGFSATSSGQVHAFLYSPALGIRDIDGSASSDSRGFGLNNLGVVAGQSSIGARPSVLAMGSAVRPLRLIDGGALTDTRGLAINDAGLAVGTGRSDSRQVATAWHERLGSIDLNEAFARNSAWRLTAATAVDNEGSVVGLADYQGQPTLFRLRLRVARAVPADIDQNNVVDNADMFLYLSNYFNGDRSARADQADALALQPLEYIDAWFKAAR